MGVTGMEDENANSLCGSLPSEVKGWWVCLQDFCSAVLFCGLGVFLLFFGLFGRSLAMKDICPDRKRNITMRYDISSSLAAAGIPPNPANQKKKLRRLPHVFCRVLELPFNSDVPVVVEENEECFRFVITTDVVFEEVRVQVTEIVPGVTKVVVGGTNKIRISLDDSEMDLWRFRLPSSTRPEQSSAVYSDGELVIIVPKDVTNAFPDEEDNGTLIRAREEYLGAALGILEVT